MWVAQRGGWALHGTVISAAAARGQVDCRSFLSLPAAQHAVLISHSRSRGLARPQIFRRGERWAERLPFAPLLQPAGKCGDLLQRAMRPGQPASLQRLLPCARPPIRRRSSPHRPPRRPPTLRSSPPRSTGTPHTQLHYERPAGAAGKQARCAGRRLRRRRRHRAAPLWPPCLGRPAQPPAGLAGRPPGGSAATAGRPGPGQQQQQWQREQQQAQQQAQLAGWCL